MNARGAGMVYRGSIEELRGAVVVWARDCQCSECAWRPQGRLYAELRVGGVTEKIHHARASSFGGGVEE